MGCSRGGSRTLCSLMSRAAHLLRRVASQIVQVSNTVGSVGTLIEVKAGCAWAAPSLASRFQLGARGFAAASDGGSRGTGTGSVPPTSSRSVESGDQDEWGSAIITGMARPVGLRGRFARGVKPEARRSYKCMWRHNVAGMLVRARPHKPPRSRLGYEHRRLLTFTTRLLRSLSFRRLGPRMGDIRDHIPGGGRRHAWRAGHHGPGLGSRGEGSPAPAGAGPPGDCEDRVHLGDPLWGLNL